MKYDLNGQDEVTYCGRCLYPNVAVNISVDRRGVCGACHLQEQVSSKNGAFWKQRWAKFLDLAAWARETTRAGYDCVVPVSGGKDSYFQVSKALEAGLHPLLVTYHGNNYLPEGQRNLDRMRNVFNVDHMIFGPGIDDLRGLNRAGFRVCGDMNWHAHAGIKTVPMRIAVDLGIPMVLWGEITWSIAGMFDLEDYARFNKRTVFEHDMRGLVVDDLISREPSLEGKVFPWLVMPSDQEFFDSGTTGLYLGNFLPWSPNQNTELMRKNFGFEIASEPFERTYRLISNLDDMHENGIHDYLKFVKFGYGRTTDHASKDIREGLMTRDEGISRVRQLDSIRPGKDLSRWLRYTGISEEEFDRTAEKFRDPRVWWIHGGEWWKMNVWGTASSYGPVLDEEIRESHN